MQEPLFHDHEPIPPPETLSFMEKIIHFFQNNPKARKQVTIFGIVLVFLLSLAYLDYFTQKTIRFGGVNMTLVVSDPEYQRYQGSRYGFDYHVMVEKNGDSVDLTYLLPHQDPQVFSLATNYALEVDLSSHIVQFHTENGIYQPDSYDHYRFVHQMTEIRGDWYFLFFAILVVFGWLLNIRYPLLQFHLRNFGMMDNASPSDLYYFTQGIAKWVLFPLLILYFLFLAVY